MKENSPSSSQEPDILPDEGNSFKVVQIVRTLSVPLSDEYTLNVSELREETHTIGSIKQPPIVEKGPRWLRIDVDSENGLLSYELPTF